MSLPISIFDSGRLPIAAPEVNINAPGVPGTVGNGIGFSSFIIPPDYSPVLNPNGITLSVSYVTNVRLVTGTTGEYKVLVSSDPGGNVTVINLAIPNSGTTGNPYPLNNTFTFPNTTAFVPNATYYVGFYGTQPSTFINAGASIAVSFNYVPAPLFDSGKLYTTVPYVGSTRVGKAFASFTVPSNFNASANTLSNMTVFLQFYANVKLMGEGNGEYHILVSSSSSGTGDIIDYKLYNPNNNQGASSNDFFYPLGPATETLTQNLNIRLNNLSGVFQPNTTYYVGIYGTVNNNYIDPGAYVGVKFYYNPTSGAYLGPYSSSLSYSESSIVFYNGSFYGCISPSINVAPSSTFNWTLIGVPKYRGFLYNVYNDMVGGYNKYDIVLWTDKKFYVKTDPSIIGLNPDQAGGGWTLFVDRTALELSYSAINVVGDICVRAPSTTAPINLYFNNSGPGAAVASWTPFLQESPLYYGLWSASAVYNYGDVISNSSEFVFSVAQNLVQGVESESLNGTIGNSYYTSVNFDSNGTLSASYQSGGLSAGSTYDLYDCGLYNNKYYISIIAGNTSAPDSDPGKWTLMNSNVPYAYKGTENRYIPYITGDIIYQDSVIAGLLLNGITPAFYIGNTNSFLGYIPNGGSNGVGIINNHWDPITPKYRGSFYSISNNTVNGYNNYDIVLYDDGYFYIKTNDSLYGILPISAGSGWTLFLGNSSSELSATQYTVSGEIWFNNNSGVSPDLKYHDVSNNTLTNVAPKFYGLYNSTTYYNYDDVVIGSDWNLYKCSGNLVVGTADVTNSTLWTSVSGSLSWKGAWATGTYSKYDIVADSGVFYVCIRTTTSSKPSITTYTSWVPITLVNGSVYFGVSNINQPYLVGDIVMDISGNNGFFICKNSGSQSGTTVFNNTPSTQPSNWTLFTPTYRGYVNTTVTYTKYDVVFYGIDSSLYIYTGSSGALFNTTTWQKFVQDPVWVSGTYSYSNLVLFGQYLYVAIGTSSLDPVADQNIWLPLKVKLTPNYYGSIGLSPYSAGVEGGIGLSETDKSFYHYVGGSWSPINLTYRGSLYDVYNDIIGGYNNYDIVLWSDTYFYIKMNANIYGKTPDQGASGWQQFLDLSANTINLGKWNDAGISFADIVIYDNAGANPMNLYFNNNGTSGNISNFTQIVNKSPLYYGLWSPTTIYNKGDFIINFNGFVFSATKNLLQNVDSSSANGTPGNANYTSVNFSSGGTLLPSYKSSGLTSGTSYRLYDCGLYLGQYYISISSSNNNTPINNTFWTLMNSKAPYLYKGLVNSYTPYINKAIVYQGIALSTTFGVNPSFYIASNNNFISYTPNGGTNSVDYLGAWTNIQPVYRGSLYLLYNNIVGGYNNYDVVLYDDGLFYIKTNSTQVGLVPNVTNSGWSLFIKDSIFTSIFSSLVTYSEGNITTWDNGGTEPIQMYYSNSFADISGTRLSSNWNKFTFKPVGYYGNWRSSAYYNMGDFVFGTDGNMYQSLNNRVRGGLGPLADNMNWQRYIYPLSSTVWSPLITYNTGDCVSLGSSGQEITVFRALQDGLLNILPAYGLTTWEYMATTNATGVTYPVKLYPIPVTWSATSPFDYPNNPYDRGDIAFDISSNNYYISIQDSNMLQPSADSLRYWTQMSNNPTNIITYEGPLYKGQWDSRIPNISGDIVQYESLFYMCLGNNFIKVPTDSSAWKQIDLIYGGQGSDKTDFGGGPYSMIPGAIDTYNISYWPNYGPGANLWIQTDPSGSQNGWYIFQTVPITWSGTNTYNNSSIVLDNDHLYYSAIDNNRNMRPVDNFNSKWMEINDIQPYLKNTWNTGRLYTRDNIVFSPSTGSNGNYHILKSAYSVNNNPTSDGWSNITNSFNYCGSVPNADSTTSTAGYPLYSIILGKYGFLYIYTPGSTKFVPFVNSFLNPTLSVAGNRLAPGQFVVYNGILYNNTTNGTITLGTGAPSTNGASVVVAGIAPINSAQGASTLILSGESGTYYLQNTFVNWKPATGVTDISGLNCMAYNGLWVAGGGKGGLYWSSFGTSWTLGSSSLTKVNAVCSNTAGTLWFAGGEGANCLLKSSNGKTWTNVSGTGLTVCNSIVFHNGVWVCGSVTGLIYSNDISGTSWSSLLTIPVPRPLSVKIISTDNSGNWLVGGPGSHMRCYRGALGSGSWDPDTAFSSILFPTNSTCECKYMQYDSNISRFLVIGNVNDQARYGSVIITNNDIKVLSLTDTTNTGFTGNLLIPEDDNIPYLALSNNLGLIYKYDMTVGATNLSVRKRALRTSNTGWVQSIKIPNGVKWSSIGTGPSLTASIGLNVIYSEGTRTALGPTNSPGPMPVCLLTGTQVKVPNGWVAIQDICVGDVVYNQNLEPVKIIRTHNWDILWGSSVFGETVYKISNGRLGATEDIYISAFHKVLINETEMLEAYQIGLPRALKNEIAPSGVYTLYHIQMEDHSKNNFIIGGNCIVESWDGRLSMEK